MDAQLASPKKQGTLQIPNNTTSNQATLTATIYSGTYQDINIPASKNETTSFTIIGSKTNQTITPTQKPTSTPKTTENAQSLFSWLLVAP